MIHDLKILKRLLFLLGGALLLLGGGFALTATRENTQDESPAYVVDTPVSQISGIVIKNAAGVLSLFHAEQGVVVMQEEEIVETDAVATQSMYYELCHLPVKRTFLQGELSVDFSKPLAHIAYMDAQGSSMTYTVAAVRGPFDEYYLRKQDADTVYLIAPEVGQYFEMNALQLRDKSVLPSLNSAVIPDIREVEILDFKGQNSYRISCSNEGGLLLYAFDEPVNNRIDANILWELLFVPLSKVYGENVVSLETAITAPDYQVSAVIKGERFTFFVKYTPDSALVYRENEPFAFAISREKLSFLAQPYETYLGGKAFSVLPGYLDRVIIQADEKEHIFEIGTSEKGVTISTQGEMQLYSEQEETFKILFEIPIQSKIGLETTVTQPPLLTVQYYYKNGMVDIVSLYEMENVDQIALFRDGASYFTTFTSTADMLMQLIMNTV